MLIEQPPTSQQHEQQQHAATSKQQTSSSEKKQAEREMYTLEPSLGITDGYNLPTVDQIFQQQNYDLFNDAFVLGGSGGGQDLFPSAESLCTNLDMLGFVSPSAIDNFSQNNQSNTDTDMESSSTTSTSSRLLEKRAKKRRGSSPATFKPPSPRGRPRSIYKPGEKPAPPNLYNVLMSPNLHSPVLLNIHSPNMPAMPLPSTMNPSFATGSPVNYFNTAGQQPSIMPAPQWIYAAAPPAAYYGYTTQPPSQTATTKIPMVPLSRPRAQSEPEAILGTPLTFSQKRQEQQLQLQQQEQTSPTSSLDSQLEAAISEDLSAAQSFMQNVHLAKEQFMTATKSLDYTNVTVHEMKAILRKFGLMTTGKKADLINRIQLTRKCLLDGNA